jgi:hypothetical protein
MFFILARVWLPTLALPLWGRPVACGGFPGRHPVLCAEGMDDSQLPKSGTQVIYYH